jgi:hypothetical protein
VIAYKKGMAIDFLPDAAFDWSALDTGGPIMSECTSNITSSGSEFIIFLFHSWEKERYLFLSKQGR